MTSSPGVFCDLLLTSLCLFEQEPGFAATVKVAMLRKWQMISRAPNSLSIMPFLYRTDSINFAYKSQLRAEIMNMNLTVSGSVSSTRVANQDLTDISRHKFHPPSPISSPIHRYLVIGMGTAI